MTDFVINNQKNDQSSSHSFLLCVQYAKFLKQPLELWMFVPCNDNGNILAMPYNYNAFTNELPREVYSYSFTDCVNYRQAKDRVLFEGVNEIQASIVLQSNLIIENIIHFDLTLTPTALKQIGL